MIGRVYKLKCGDKFYIGSTSMVLDQRLRKHKSAAKSKPLKCHKYFNEQCWNNVTIELLEEGEFENRKALCKREGEYIVQYINDENCLNCSVAGRTHAESVKAYHDTHREKRNAQKRAARAAKKNVYKFLD
jgi:hypothetical protein